jgi:hypothetical protein
MIIDGEDGITHINIYSKAFTKLGKWLSNFSYSPFYIDGLLFNSVEAAWYWWRTGEDSLRELSGFKAKQEGKKFAAKRDIDQDFICKCIDEKLRANPSKCRELSESTLPFAHYYEYGSKRVDAGYEWILEHVEKRRKQLKEHYGNRA